MIPAARSIDLYLIKKENEIPPLTFTASLADVE